MCPMRESVSGTFVMRRFVPALIAANTARRFVGAVPHDQAFATLVLPAPGELTWTVQDRIVAEFMALDIEGPFAIIRWPVTLTPFFIRANGTRYALNAEFDNPPGCWSVPYAGQVITSEAVFEYWSAGDIPGGEDIPDVTLTISLRKQLNYTETLGDEYIATPYSIYGRPYPVSLPISMVL
jgi:hypothetical protein